MEPSTTNYRPQPTANNTTITVPRLMTPDGVADYLVCTPAYIRELLRSGRMRGYRIGGPTSPCRIERTDFLDYIDEQKRRAAHGARRILAPGGAP